MTETGGSGGGGGGEVMMWSLWNQNIVSEDNFYIFKSEKEKDWACCCGGGGDTRVNWKVFLISFVTKKLNTKLFAWLQLKYIPHSWNSEFVID